MQDILVGFHGAVKELGIIVSLAEYETGLNMGVTVGQQLGKHLLARFLLTSSRVGNTKQIKRGGIWRFLNRRLQQ